VRHPIISAGISSFFGYSSLRKHVKLAFWFDSQIFNVINPDTGFSTFSHLPTSPFLFHFLALTLSLFFARLTRGIRFPISELCSNDLTALLLRFGLVRNHWSIALSSVRL
jgi:uncharacterized membrane protein (UPF0182 family)